MNMVKEQKLLKGIDGYHVGTLLKSGELSKNAYHISDKEIVMMFEDYLRRYCVRNDENVLMVYRNGRMVFEALMHEKDGTFKVKK